MTNRLISWQSVVDAAEAVRLICESIDQTANEHKGTWAANSQAASEITSCKDPGMLDVALKNGNLALIVGADYGLSLQRSIVSGEPLAFAPWGNVREVLENAAKCHWLLDSQIGPLERIGRAMVDDLNDIESCLNYSRRSDPGWPGQVHDGDGMIAQMESRRQTVLNSASRLDIDVNKISRAWSITDRILDAFNDPAIYSLLSPAAHGNPRLTLALSAQIEAGGPPHMRTGLKNEYACEIVLRGLDWLARALWTQYRIFGWDWLEKQPILEQAYNRAGLQPSGTKSRIKVLACRPTSVRVNKEHHSGGARPPALEVHIIIVKFGCVQPHRYQLGK